MSQPHHPPIGNDGIRDDSFLDALDKADVKLCLHGHVHEDHPDRVASSQPQRQLRIAGAGTFGVGVRQHDESAPRVYNMIEVWRDHSKVRVHTRCMKRDASAWEAWAVWPRTKGALRAYYDIEFELS